MASPIPSPLYHPDFEHDACGVGFIARVTGERSHDVVDKAVAALKSLAHRGAIDADAVTGDGAGLLTQIPIELLREHLERLNQPLSRDQDLGVGMIFLPRANEPAQAHCKNLVEQAAKDEGLAFLGWRDVPTDNASLGRKAIETQPVIVQALVARTHEISDDEFERKLFLAQKTSERKVFESGVEGFYICSFSSRTIVYKGLVTPLQIRKFYPDLKSPKFTSAYAIFHQRYSTNTFPTWHLAHPFRMMAHNGEINTIRGNRNLMRARERSADGGVWGERFADLRPLVQPGMSDSASFDNVLQLLTLGGRDALQAAMMMAPMAWEKDASLTPEARAFFRYHSCMLEPWDGPAAIVFTDGKVVGATLDRNGLRPARFKIFDDGYFMLASEAGLVFDFPGKVVQSGRLGPGRMIAIDLAQKRVVMDEEIRATITARHDYRAWCDQHLVNLHRFAAGQVGPDLVSAPSISADGTDARSGPAPELSSQIAFGYDLDELELILTPLADGLEPTGSMGDDTPLAVLSRRPRLLYSYFKQLFAQVTNPPIDSIREKSVMSLTMYLGGRLGLFEESPQTKGLVELETPILGAAELAALDTVPALRGHVVTLSVLFDAAAGAGGLEAALKNLAAKAQAAVEQSDAKVIVLSDRGVSRENIAAPMLLAVGAVHQQLVRSGLRIRCDLVAESGEARDVHHLACLLGFGANAINPWLALDLVSSLASAGKTAKPVTAEQARKNYSDTIAAGLLKIMAKMGISTLFSYRGAQIFEALGISAKIMGECFTGTPSPIGGLDYQQIAEEAFVRHGRAFPSEEAVGPAPTAAAPALHNEGYYRVNKKGEGEFHGWNPKVVAAMNRFTRSGSADDFAGWRGVADEHQPLAIKDLLKLRYGVRPAVALEEVEAIEDIRQRFTTAGMSLGALSPEAHEALAIAMNRIGGKSNSGEGGEDPARFNVRENGDSANSAIKQVASGRFGVTAEYLANAKEIEIKMAQGAKPGEGGQLPGAKVSPLIARLRFSVPGVMLISPPPHHDIYSIEDLAQLIFDLKEVNPRAKVCVKLVSCSGVGTVAAGVAKAYADVILVSGHEGGTGASPLASIKNAGSAWEIGVAEAHQVLMMNGLRNRVVLRTDGGMKTGRDIVVAALLGAEEFNFGTAALIAAGCAMFRVCHLNTCPVGVATQRDDLRAKFRGKPENVINYFNAVAEDVRGYLAKLGARTLNEIVGRTELLEQIDDPANPKTRFVNLAGLLHNPDPTGELPRYHTRERNERFGSEGSLDESILQEARDVILGRGGRFVGRYKITNVNRDIGTHLSGQIAYQRGNHALVPATIDLSFTGSAGQSFGAFLVQGVRLTLIGEANDYVGKGIAGGEIIIRPKPGEIFAWKDNCIAGNTCLYGATGGAMFAAGWAGERFAVRNSGATAVVEGAGDHGCEYMTGGVVAVLGRVGKNFGAGMSGGLAFVYDERDMLPGRINPAMISLERMTPGEESDSLRQLIARHGQLTGSPHAAQLLAGWEGALTKFWKVVPHPPTPDTPKAIYRFEPLKPLAAV